VGGEVCTDSEDSAEACAAFLLQIDRCASTLRVKAASRAYRTNFTVHYRAAVPDGGRHYRVEVLAASLAQHGAIWVNGAKFDFSSEVLHCGGALKRQLAQLCAYLADMANSDPPSPTSSSGAKCPQAAKRAELVAQLVSFDNAWTSFEEAYIGQLMEIEKSARGLLVEAIDQERCLRILEETSGNGGCNELFSEQYAEQQRRLFTCLSCLNSVANINRKGREDLGPEVFNAATKAMQRGDTAPDSPIAVIITEVAETFQGIRDYLRQVEPLLDQVAPRLSENSGLAARLAQLEEGWELGSTYLLNEPMRNAMNCLVMELKAILSRNADLTRLCESCDVEWLLVLPKLVWLCYLEYPERHAEVVKSLLPHRFPQDCSSSHDVQKYGDAELQALGMRFRRVYVSLAKMTTMTRRGNAWDILVRWSSFGPEGVGMLRITDSSEAREDLCRVAEFAKELDGWSMELQRHCPQDWNQCGSLLMRCLTGQRSLATSDFVI
jgi:hypothetical protein